MGHHAYRARGALLEEVHARYGRPLFIAETGAERSGCAAWLHHVGEKVRAAIAAGVPVGGICLYPILDYPGWENDRGCAVGLPITAATDGSRAVHRLLARELAAQQGLFADEATRMASALSGRLAAVERQTADRKR